MPDFRSFATEDDYNAHASELKQGVLTELGFETIEALQESLNRNPDDELTAQNTQLTEQLAQVTRDSEKSLIELKRELSGKLGINLFDEQALETFLSGVTATQDQLNALKDEKAQIIAQKDAVDIENNLLKVGIQVKRIDRAKGLVLSEVQGGKSVKEAVESLIAEFPEWIGGSGSVGANLHHDNSNLTEREIYLRDNGYTK